MSTGFCATQALHLKRVFTLCVGNFRLYICTCIYLCTRTRFKRLSPLWHYCVRALFIVLPALPNSYDFCALHPKFSLTFAIYLKVLQHFAIFYVLFVFINFSAVSSCTSCYCAGSFHVHNKIRWKAGKRKNPITHAYTYLAIFTPNRNRQAHLKCIRLLKFSVTQCWNRPHILVKDIMWMLSE